MVDVVRDQPLLDDLADEIKIGLRGRRKPDFDFFEADLDEQVEHAAFAGRIHRLDERLVAVAQIDAAPGGRSLDRAAGPTPIDQIDGSERAVFRRRILQHDVLAIAMPIAALSSLTSDEFPVLSAPTDSAWVIAPSGAGAQADAAPGGGAQNSKIGSREHAWHRNLASRQCCTQGPGGLVRPLDRPLRPKSAQIPAKSNLLSDAARWPPEPRHDDRCR